MKGRPKYLGSAFVFWLTVACGAARYTTEQGHAQLVAPVAIAEAKPKPKAQPKVETKAKPSQAVEGEQTGAPASKSGAATTSATLPDPPPLNLREHFDYQLRFERGQVRVLVVTPVTTAKPLSTQRTMGRFAIELWIGPELVDRVRFDFPLLGAEPPPSDVEPLNAPPSFAAGAVVERTVRVPRSPRATRAELVDRASGEVIELAWPPPLQAAGEPAPTTSPSDSSP